MKLAFWRKEPEKPQASATIRLFDLVAQVNELLPEVYQENPRLRLYNENVRSAPQIVHMGAWSSSQFVKGGY